MIVADVASLIYNVTVFIQLVDASAQISFVIMLFVTGLFVVVDVSASLVYMKVAIVLVAILFIAVVTIILARVLVAWLFVGFTIICRLSSC